MRVDNNGPCERISEAVLFPFDDRSMPFRYRLQTGLVTGINPWRGHHIVLEKGAPEQPDGIDISFYGTIIRIGDELRMWYIGWGKNGEEFGGRICYAVSTDGMIWEKPELGLVEFNGSTKNNLVCFDSQYKGKITALLVLYEPDDPDPERRFKLINEVTPFHNIAAYSPDGLHWSESTHNPILKHNSIEPGGLMKFGNRYFLTGQGGNVGSKRALVTYVSYDFDHWTEAVVVGLRRDRPPYRMQPGPHAGEQVHLGASLWNRGNVILGLYGIWHGESNDRRHISMDLGFVFSTDGLHFTEPEPDFPLIEAYEVEPESREQLNRMVPPPCLEQGQGFENMGDETLIWYSPWRGGFVCVARWPRDRLGYAEVVPDPRPKLLMPEDTHTMFWGEHVDIPIQKTDPHIISCPVRLDSPAKVYLNTNGLTEQSGLVVEVLDKKFQPLPGYSGENCVPIHESDLRQPVSWKGTGHLKNFDQPIRLKVVWRGERPEDAFLYAAYIEEGDF